MRLKQTQIKVVFRNRLNEDEEKETLQVFNEFATNFNISQRIHYVRFFAQVLHEASIINGKFTKRENLKYRLSSLYSLQKRHPRKNGYNIIQTISRTKGINRDKLIARFLYGGRMGNHIYDHGYKYRGAGAIMVTGKNTTEEILKLVKERTDIDINLDDDMSVRDFWLISFGFWCYTKLYNCNNTNCVTNKVNSGLTKRKKAMRLKSAIMLNHVL